MTFCAPSEVLMFLYIFISNIGLIGVCIWIVIMSDDAKSTCVHLLVGMLLLMSSSDLVLA